MQYTSEEYIMEHWQAREVWRNLERPKHQERFTRCASFCVGQRFLDMGCACGHSTQYLKERKPGFWLGADMSETAVQAAQINFPEIPFLLIEGVENLCELARFNLDSIVCSEVIEHVEDDQALVEELYALVRHRLIVTTPTRDVGDPGHVRLYTAKALRELFAGIPCTIQGRGDFFYVVCERPKDESGS